MNLVDGSQQEHNSALLMEHQVHFMDGVGMNIKILHRKSKVILSGPQLK